jgi:hypothetical protein
MSFQICLKTDKPLQQLAVDICKLFSLPPYKQDTFAGEPYFQFEMLGMLVLVHPADEEDRDPEVKQYPYCFDMQMIFTEHELNTDELEYQLQPYYAQLLSFHLGIDTAHHEKQKVNQRWQIRYRFYSKNPQWNAAILFGEEGWQPAVIEKPPSAWRHMHPVF